MIYLKLGLSDYINKSLSFIDRYRSSMMLLANNKTNKKIK